MRICLHIWFEFKYKTFKHFKHAFIKSYANCFPNRNRAIHRSQWHKLFRIVSPGFILWLRGWLVERIPLYNCSHFESRAISSRHNADSSLIFFFSFYHRNCYVPRRTSDVTSTHWTILALLVVRSTRHDSTLIWWTIEAGATFSGASVGNVHREKCHSDCRMIYTPRWKSHGAHRSRVSTPQSSNTDSSKFFCPPIE